MPLGAGGGRQRKGRFGRQGCADAADGDVRRGDAAPVPASARVYCAQFVVNQ